VNTAITTQDGIAYELERLLGAEAVCHCEEVNRFAIDDVLPAAAVRPRDGEQVAAVLRVANERDWSVVPFGGGTRRSAGRAPERIDVALSTERLKAVERYDPGDLTIGLQAGARAEDIAALCAAERQLFALEAPELATIGGALAGAESGPLRAGYGAPRDFCIGVNFVTGDGVAGRGGGRVVKNVAGYDMMKLLIGSHGTLGVIVSANFKLFPLPQNTATFSCEFESLAKALEFRDALLRSPVSPICAELISPAADEYVRGREPRDPDHWSPAKPVASHAPPWRIVLRFAGSQCVLQRCRQELGAALTSEIGGADERSFWAGVRAFESRTLAGNRNAMILHVSAPIAELERLIKSAESAATDCNFIVAVIGRATVGALVLAFLPLAIHPPNVAQFACAASAFRAQLSRETSAVVVQCPKEAKPHFGVWGSTPTDLGSMRRIKQAFDPKNILNRGRFILG
jgi:glycolate oxidase FAD binding subunit